MIVDIVMPKMGESITEGTIIEWKKNLGDPIALDEILLEIGTDKVDSEIPSAIAGTVVELLAEPNDVIEVGAVIARIKTDTEADSEDIELPIVEVKKSEVKRKNDPEKLDRKPINVAPDSSHSLEKNDGRFYTPVVQKIAQEKGISNVDLSAISGSGKNGRVTKKDILSYIENKGISTASPDVIGERTEMGHMRKLIADHMRKSLDTSAHAYLMSEVDMTSIVEFVAKQNESFARREGFPLTYTPFIVLATVQALIDFPDMNSSLEETTIIRNKNINIGLAVAVEKGLMVPVISHCEELNFLGLCRKIRDIAVRTRDKKINPSELQGSTFSITNYGIFDVTMGTSIINQPNVGILGVGTIKKRPVVLESTTGDSIGIRSIMGLTLGIDHRLIDGAGGARFIETVQKNLKSMELDKLF